MKVYRYDELLAFSYDQIEQIADGSTSFSVQANPDKGRRIARFLANETAFRKTKRRFRDRLNYFFRGMAGVSIPAFMPIWNKAVMNGYSITCEEQESNVCIVFKAARAEEES